MRTTTRRFVTGWLLLLIIVAGTVLAGLVLNLAMDLALIHEAREQRTQSQPLVPRHPTAHIDTQSVYCAKNWPEWCRE